MTTQSVAETGDLRHVRARDGILLPYEVLGAGEPVVFLHGGFAGRDSFAHQKPLAAWFRLILRDLRGHNGVPPGDLIGYSIETTEIDDLLRVLDAERIDRAHLIGHADGGATAFAFARQHPERVQCLVLLEPTLWRLLPSDQFAVGLAFHEEMRVTAEREGPEAAFEAFVARMAGPDWQTRRPPAVVAQMRAFAGMLVAHYEALMAMSVSDEDVRRLAMPVLLVYAGRSLDVEVHLAARFRELRPDIEQILIEDAGHTMHRQRPERVNAAIRDFLLPQRPAWRKQLGK